MDEMAPRQTRRWGWRVRAACAALAALLLCLPACTWDGNFTLLGYTTKANYDPQYKTVRVPIFKNKSYWVVDPIPGMEMNLTEEVVRAITSRTPYKVVGANEPADTEIQGSIVGMTKAIINYNQLYEQRETEVTLVCQINWQDLRTGKPITRLGRKAFGPYLPDPVSPVSVISPTQAFNQSPIQATPNQTANDQLIVPQPANSMATPGTLGNITPVATPGAPGAVAGIGVILRSVTYYRVELGQSTATAEDQAYQNMGIKVTELMELPW